MRTTAALARRCRGGLISCNLMEILIGALFLPLIGRHGGKPRAGTRRQAKAWMFRPETEHPRIRRDDTRPPRRALAVTVPRAQSSFRFNVMAAIRRVVTCSLGKTLMIAGRCPIPPSNPSIRSARARQ